MYIQTFTVMIGDLFQFFVHQLVVDFFTFYSQGEMIRNRTLSLPPVLHLKLIQHIILYPIPQILHPPSVFKGFFLPLSWCIKYFKLLFYILPQKYQGIRGTDATRICLQTNASTFISDQSEISTLLTLLTVHLAPQGRSQ